MSVSVSDSAHFDACLWPSPDESEAPPATPSCCQCSAEAKGDREARSSCTPRPKGRAVRGRGCRPAARCRDESVCALRSTGVRIHGLPVRGAVGCHLTLGLGLTNVAAVPHLFGGLDVAPRAEGPPPD
eukprot:CAMPEP_0185198270 /NCGR_PEP_ID=MMETSP1140-20130426/42483_1 /TAXON_ID=298111 /ORGANISM="Pavlova sp., Strain CCMP459" /LENGTH=127 /DNA_ID=CAMNT_0027765453 /DNA_START=174 /DNA_END=557 /DNA_ORIENTATION=-